MGFLWNYIVKHAAQHIFSIVGVKRNIVLCKKINNMIYIDGDFKTVRRLQQDNNELKARIAQLNARSDDFTTFTVETIN